MPPSFLALANALWLNDMLWKCDLSQKTCDKLWCNYAGFPLVLLNGCPKCCQILSIQLPLFLLSLKMKVFGFLFSFNCTLKVLHKKRWDLRSRLISRCQTFSGSTMASRLPRWRLWSCKWAKADVAALLVLTDWSSRWLSPTLPLAWSLKAQVIFHCSKTQNNKNNISEKIEPVREVGFSRYTFLRNHFPITKKLFNPRCFIFLVN